MQKIKRPKSENLGILGKAQAVPNKNIDRKFTLKSTLLKGSIGHVTTLIDPISQQELLLYGFQNDKKGCYVNGRGFFGYPLLCLLLEMRLKIKRFKRYQDRIIADLLKTPHDREGFSIFLNYFGKQAIQEAAYELEALYHHTQRQLREVMPDQQTIKLCRGISGEYAEKIIKCYWACKLLGTSSFQIETDILNSYSDDGAYNDRNLVVLTQDIPFKNILYCHEFIADHDTAVAEEAEWVVLNFAADGLTRINTQDIQASVNQTKKFDSHRIKYKWYAKLFLSHYKPMLRSKKCS